MKTIFITVAYNAEKTIGRTIESILEQSHPDFIYYIADNGSTDSTGKIIRKYSQIDSRIVVISKTENDIWLFFEILPEILKKHNRTDYLCSIDADDTYNYDFLEKMLAFMQREHLDIAACGNDFIDSETGKVKNNRKIENDLVLEGSGFSDYFPYYYQFMRTVWGKIYSLSILLEDKFEPRHEMGYGGDTVFAIETFRRANRVGIFAESLHKYYMSQKSASHKLNPKRIISDRILFDVGRDFLISKVGNITKQNEEFLFRVYFKAVIDTINVLLDAQIDVSDKFTNLIDIIQSQHTQALIKWTGMVEQKNHVLGQIANWVSSQSPLLARVDVGFLEFFHEIVISILKNEYEKALSQIEDAIVQEIDIPVQYIEAFFALGLNLSAKLERSDDFVYFKKLQISLLIDFSRIDQAKEELVDWAEMLPNDMDFKELRIRLTQNQENA
jgi:glycosyltransferase involved in cell wall biosynthesis